MQNRIVEIATDGIHLSLTRGFVRLFKDGSEIGRIGLPDIGALIVRGYGASLSLNLAARLAAENIPVVLCGPDQAPASIVWPVSGHHAQGHIIEGQGKLSLPRKKQVWKTLISAKIRAQAEVLEAEGENAADLHRMAKTVKSGDPDNLEAQAARKYWPRLMHSIDESFTRSADSDAISGNLNGWLNYGYAVLRAGAARSVLASGLHPSLSVHHKSRGEALRLTSDLMEPFRPFVDLTVHRLALKEDGPLPDLDRDRKAAIVRVLSRDLNGETGASPVQTCLDRLCQSFARLCLGETKTLVLPDGLALPSGGMAV
ncbi:MAG: type II CRISPR-associated endonuclease Cas1 [Pseudomonadota bacterium]